MPVDKPKPGESEEDYFQWDEDKLKKEIATMTIKDNAMRRQATLVEEGDDKGYRRMVFHVPVDGPMKWGGQNG
jgi:hypothetical protein